MRTVRLKRLFLGLASIRDYIVDDALKNNEGITIICKDQQMHLSPEDLKTGQRGTETFTSKFDGKKYKLVDYKWRTGQKGLGL